MIAKGQIRAVEFLDGVLHVRARVRISRAQGAEWHSVEFVVPRHESKSYYVGRQVRLSIGVR
jgi:hypothetical protein